MSRSSRCLFLLALPACFAVLLQAAPEAVSPEVVTPQAAARRFLDILVAGKFDQAVKGFDETVSGALPAPKLKQVFQGLLSQTGPFLEVTEVRQKATGQYTTVDLICSFEKTPLVTRVAFDAKGHISGLWFLPVARAIPKTPEGPNTPEGPQSFDGFREELVTVGKKPWQLPGTLVIPEGKAPFPAVLLLAGSGPNDRDETIGPNAPLRDIAHALGKAGVISLRYDKRTLRHGAKMVGAKVTVREEVLDDAQMALDLLRHTSVVDKAHLFCLGHSLGATLAPMVADEDMKLRGIIMLAPLGRSLLDAMREQLTYLASLDSAGKEAKEKTAKIIAELDRMKEGTFDGPVLGLTKHYLDDFESRDILAAAAKLSTPIFIARGDRDYQVTKADVALWRKAISGKKGVAFKSYPGLNHLFGKGTGTSTPEEYGRRTPVDEALLKDIVRFVLADGAPKTK